MKRLSRADPFPEEMQGRWVGVYASDGILTVDQAEVNCFGSNVAYDYKELKIFDEATLVNLRIEDEALEDEFQRRHITGLALERTGEFHVWNVKFASTFRRE